MKYVAVDYEITVSDVPTKLLDIIVNIRYMDFNYHTMLEMKFETSLTVTSIASVVIQAQGKVPGIGGWVFLPGVILHRPIADP